MLFFHQLTFLSGIAVVDGLMTVYAVCPPFGHRGVWPEGRTGDRIRESRVGIADLGSRGPSQAGCYGNPGRVTRPTQRTGNPGRERSEPGVPRGARRRVDYPGRTEASGPGSACKWVQTSGTSPVATSKAHNSGTRQPTESQRREHPELQHGSIDHGHPRGGPTPTLR